MKCTARTKYIAGVDVYPPAMEECGTEMEQLKSGIQVLDKGYIGDYWREELHHYTLYQCPSCKSIKLD